MCRAPVSAMTTSTRQARRDCEDRCRRERTEQLRSSQRRRWPLTVAHRADASRDASFHSSGRGGVNRPYRLHTARPVIIFAGSGHHPGCYCAVAAGSVICASHAGAASRLAGFGPRWRQYGPRHAAALAARYAPRVAARNRDPWPAKPELHAGARRDTRRSGLPWRCA